MAKNRFRAITRLFRYELSTNASQKKGVPSSLHMSIGIGSPKKQNPERIEFYNTTKCGVHEADQMTRQHSVKTGSRRWLVALFLKYLRFGLYQCVRFMLRENGKIYVKARFYFQTGN